MQGKIYQQFNLSEEERFALAAMLAGYFHDVGKAYHRFNLNTDKSHQELSSDFFKELREIFEPIVGKDLFIAIANAIRAHHFTYDSRYGDVKESFENLRKKGLDEKSLIILKILMLSDHLDSAFTRASTKDESEKTSSYDIYPLTLTPLWMLDDSYDDLKDINTKYVVGSEVVKNKTDLSRLLSSRYYSIKDLLSFKNEYVKVDKVYTLHSASVPSFGSFDGRLSFNNIKSILLDAYNEYLNASTTSFSKDKLYYFLDILDNIFYDYFYSLNASHYSSKKGDVVLYITSLYYHLKMTGLIAYSLMKKYFLRDDFKSKINDIKNVSQLKKLEEVFIKNSGSDYGSILKSLYLDVSGIQKFITGLSDIENLDKTAKILRGRSLYLEFLQKAMAHLISNALSLPYNFIMKDNGGFIFMLLPADAVNEKVVNDMIESINYSLYQKYKGKIYVYGEIGDLDVILQNPTSIYYRRKLSNLKRNKYAGIVNSLKKYFGEFNSSKWNKDLCPYCGVNPLDETYKDPTSGEPLKMCRYCMDHYEFGYKVVKEGFAVVFNLKQNTAKGKVSINLKSSDTRLSIDFYPLLNTKNKGFTGYPYYFIEDANSPKYPFIVSGLYAPKKLELEENEEKYVVKSFEDISLVKGKSKNDVRANEPLALVKIDVNNLGLLEYRVAKVAETLISLSGDADGFKGISLSHRYALYKHIEHFFTFVLRSIIYSKQEYKEKVYVLYAGGDDLIVVLPLSVLFEFLNDVYKRFKLIQNKESSNEKELLLTIKGVVYLFNHKFPLYLAYKYADSLMPLVDGSNRKVKYVVDNETNTDLKGISKSYFVFGEPKEIYVHKWSDIAKFIKFRNDLLNKELSNNVSLSKLYKLYEIQQRYYLYKIYANKDKINDNSYLASLMKSANFVSVPSIYVDYIFRDLLKDDDSSLTSFIDDVKDYIEDLDYASLHKYYVLYRRFNDQTS